MAVNPYGYVPVTDGGAPRIITGYAKEVISGGQFVGASGAADLISSGADSFTTADLQFYLTLGSANFIGIALHDVASGAPLSVATRGAFILECSGATEVMAGEKVGINNDNQIIWIGSHELGYQPYQTGIGRAWLTGSDSQFIVVDVHG